MRMYECEHLVSGLGLLSYVCESVNTMSFSVSVSVPTWAVMWGFTCLCVREHVSGFVCWCECEHVSGCESMQE